MEKEGEYVKTCPLFPGPEYRSVFMTEIFELVYHGGGGFSWSEVYNMPINHRRFNLKKINEYLERVEEVRNEKNKTITEKTDPSKINIPEFAKSKSEEPTFVSKVKPKS
jgi:hypothetical protein